MSITTASTAPFGSSSTGKDILTNLAWNQKTWEAGEPISKEKMDMVSNGLVICFTRIQAIIQEILQGGGYIDNEDIDNALKNTRIDRAENRINGLNNVDEDLQNQINAIDNVLSIHSGNLDILNNWKNEIEAWKTNINTWCESIDSWKTTVNSDIQNLKNRMSAVENRLGEYESRLTADEARITKNEQDIDILEQCCDQVRETIGTEEESIGFSILRTLKIQDSNIEKMLKYFIYNTNAFIIKMNYNFPFLMGSTTNNTDSYNPSSISFGLPEDISQITSGTAIPKINAVPITIKNTNNLWPSTTPTGLTKNGSTYSGTATAFKNAFAAIIGNNTAPVKISFDFQFGETPQELRFYFNYSESGVPTDNRSYLPEKGGYHRLSFIPQRKNESNSNYWGINGIKTFSYNGTENATYTLKDIVVTREMSAASTATETWNIPLPRTLYGGKIDFENNQIVSYYGHVSSYDGGVLPTNHYPANPGTGDEYVYKFDTNQIYKIEWGITTFAQGFNTVPTQTEILDVDYDG